MSRINVLFALVLSSLYLLSAAKSPSSFIEAECRATLYPTLCVQSLSNYSKIVLQSPRELARAALSVGLSRAQIFSSSLSKMAMMRGLKPTELQAVRDCSDNMAGAVHQLSLSLKELGSSGKQKQPPSRHQGSVESWVGAAITFEQTCLDGFSSPSMEGNVKVVVLKRVVECKQVTSNALALIHRYSMRKGRASTQAQNLP